MGMNRRIVAAAAVVLVCLAVGGLVRLTRRGRSPEAQPGAAGSSGAVLGGAIGAPPGAGRGTPPVDSAPVTAPTLPEGATLSGGELMTYLHALPCSPAVAVIIGTGTPAPDNEARRKALRELDRHLTPADIAAMRLLMHTKAADVPAIPPASFYALKNDVLDILLRQDQLVVGLGGELAMMYMDETHDGVWRDYCIQYLGPYYEQRWSPSETIPSAADPEKTAVIGAYWDAVTHAEGTLAGTSLIGLESLSRRYAEISREEVGANASRIALSEEAGEPSRITALRLCGMLGRTDVLESVRMLSQVGSTETLRLAAIVTLGEIGDREDVELLSSLKLSDDPRVNRLASTALEGLIRRLDA